MPFSYALPLYIGKTWLNLQLKSSCSQKPAKKPMQKLPKNPTKIQQKTPMDQAKIFYLDKNFCKALTKY
jgi:hypothetical protein